MVYILVIFSPNCESFIFLYIYIYIYFKYFLFIFFCINTLSCRIDNVVALCYKGNGFESSDNTLDLQSAVTFASGAWCNGGEVNSQSIRSTVSDAIVRSWLWSIATESCQLGYFSSIASSSL